jgi:hypothetical protein
MTLIILTLTTITKFLIFENAVRDKPMKVITREKGQTTETYNTLRAARDELMDLIQIYVIHTILSSHTHLPNENSR